MSLESAKKKKKTDKAAADLQAEALAAKKRKEKNLEEMLKRQCKFFKLLKEWKMWEFLQLKQNVLLKKC